MSISNNTPKLQSLLEKINALPEASSGVELPELSNAASAGDILSGKEAIDSEGNIITGTIATKTASNLTASGATVTVPAGYYASQATKSVSTATQAAPSVSIDSTGKITASATQSAGYVSAGTKTGTKQLTVQAAKTITPSAASQTAVASGVYTTGAVTVAAVPTQTKTVTPTTSVQTVTPDSGKFLSSVTVEAMPEGENLDTELSTQTTLITEQDAKIAELAEILSSKSSVSYPTLSNPATAENLQEGYQLIDGSGNVVTGTHVCSSDGSVETCTVTIAGMPEVDIMYYSNGSEFVEHSDGVYPEDSFTVAKNTMIYFDAIGYTSGFFDGIENVEEISVDFKGVVLAIYGDCTIEM